MFDQKRKSHEPASDQKTWQQFFVSIEKCWSQYAHMIHPFYFNHINKLREFTKTIPSLSDVQEMLKPIGWQAVHVEGYAPPWEISRMYDQQTVAISKTIRTPEEVDFANEPDLIHDFFGHLPCLFSPEYRTLLKAWSAAASKAPVSELDKAYYHLNKVIAQTEGHIESKDLEHLKKASKEISFFTSQSPTPVLIFDHAYFWIFEFGIVKHNQGIQVLGAGLLSSLNELKKLAAGDFFKASLDAKSARSSYHISVQQDGYLMAENIDQYFSILKDIKNGV